MNIIKIIKQSTIIPTDFKSDIISRIHEIVGEQEMHWLNNNDSNLDAYILYRYKFKKFPKERILEGFPLHLLIELTSICNLSCVMCFQQDKDFKDKGMMDFGLFRSIIDQAIENKCQAITFSCRGEPTLHPQFKKMIEYCKDKFFELKINTNATTLTKELSRLILDCGVNIVVFSVDSHIKEKYEQIRRGANFEAVFANIKQFMEIKKSNSKYNKTIARISGVFFKNFRHNKKSFLSFWNEIVDQASYDKAIPRWDSYHNKPINYKCPCSLLWQRIYIWHNGLCNPCDFDYKSYLSMGDAKNKSIKQIWEGQRFAEIRKMHLAGKRGDFVACKRCNYT